MKTELFTRLPLGAVEATSFLKTQLELQRDGITGKMEEYPDFCSNSGWLGGDGESWERGPYYVRGLVALAYTLKDEAMIQKAYKWMDWALSSQREDGNFGPMVMVNEWWAKMPMLMAIRDFYEAEVFRGNTKDSARVLNFFEKYFSFQAKELPKRPLDGWARARGGDNAEVVLWYYKECKKLTGEEKTWLCDLAKLLIDQSEDWVHIFANTPARHHVVNTTQAYRTPYLKYQLTGNEADKEALWKGFDNIRADHGRIDNLPNADEAARDNLPTRGTESCAVVEGMLSMEICGAITGEARIYDNLENYCYNALPNAFTYDLRLHTYYQLQNEVMATQGFHEFDCDHGDSSAFGAPCGFDCCFSNSHMGYPKFVQNMWMATEDGLVAVCYGPNQVNTTYNGKQIGFRQETRYPFSTTARFVYTGEPCSFTLRLRVPGWAEGVSLNAEHSVEAGYLVITKEFLPGDTLDVAFDCSVQIKDWHHGGRYVSRGPLLYCLPIQEEYRTVNHDDYREIKFEAHADGPNTEIYPSSRWNYALGADWIAYDEQVAENPLADQPFSPEGAPCSVVVEVQEMDSWQLSGNKAGIFSPAGVVADESKKQYISLIPYGCSRLKISVFPKIQKEAVAEEPTSTFEITAGTAFECIQVSYTRAPGKESQYVLQYGEKPGCYDHTIYGITFNQYKGGGHMFAKDKFAFTVKNNGTYYVRMFAVANGIVTAESNEIEVVL